MLARKPPVPVAAEGVIVYGVPAVCVPLRVGEAVKVTPVTVSPVTAVALLAKKVVYTPLVKLAPKVSDGPVAVMVRLAAVTVPEKLT